MGVWWCRMPKFGRPARSRPHSTSAMQAGAGTRWGVRCLECALARGESTCGCNEQEPRLAGASVGRTALPARPKGGRAQAGLSAASSSEQQGVSPSVSHEENPAWVILLAAQLDVSWHRFAMVALSSAMTVRDRWKESIVVCKYKLYSPNKQDAKQQQQRKGCSCCGGSISVDSDCVRPCPAASPGLSPCSSAVRKGGDVFQPRQECLLVC
ncbi:uncharacterized protein LOC121232591 [Aquila chrysaetos chrysaetos]|uniref:uncharacterized protein LOC121232591 n=1 Tax=Aquila chrysaetos chrysaetos TaxID=223781 RepID=UPI001B7D3BBB|nr:uncharacterized protein LOC121232591 [Aquila chrysaetos chrysaetos]